MDISLTLATSLFIGTRWCEGSDWLSYWFLKGSQLLSLRVKVARLRDPRHWTQRLLVRADFALRSPEQCYDVSFNSFEILSVITILRVSKTYSMAIYMIQLFEWARICGNTRVESCFGIESWGSWGDSVLVPTLPTIRNCPCHDKLSPKIRLPLIRLVDQSFATIRHKY
jgi:hypothetical protein